MKQKNELTWENEDGLYSKMMVSSIYKKNNELFFFITLTKKQPDEKTQAKLITTVIFENGAEANLEISDVFMIYPKDGINKISKDSRMKAKEALHDATCIYGKDMQQHKSQDVVSVKSLPWLNITWLHRNIFSMQNMIWGATGLGAIVFFAMQRFGNTEPDVLPDNGPNVKVSL